jgi:anti-sigma factor RsiW
MKPEVLRALLVDRELGELSPDVKELLDAYLEAVPSARAEVDATTRNLSIARETVRRFPDLAPTSETEAECNIVPMIPWLVPWLSRAAALIGVAGLSIWIGYHAGVSGGRADKTVAVARIVDHRFDGLWTRYQVAYDSQRAGFVVEKEQ